MADRSGNQLLQSRNNVFPVWGRMGRETKALVQNEIAPVLAEMEHACEVELPQKHGIKPPRAKDALQHECQVETDG